MKSTCLSQASDANLIFGRSHRRLDKVALSKDGRSVSGIGILMAFIAILRMRTCTHWNSPEKPQPRVVAHN